MLAIKVWLMLLCMVAVVKSAVPDDITEIIVMSDYLLRMESEDPPRAAAKYTQVMKGCLKALVEVAGVNIACGLGMDHVAPTLSLMPPRRLSIQKRGYRTGMIELRALGMLGAIIGFAQIILNGSRARVHNGRVEYIGSLVAGAHSYTQAYCLIAQTAANAASSFSSLVIDEETLRRQILTIDQARTEFADSMQIRYNELNPLSISYSGHLHMYQCISDAHRALSILQDIMQQRLDYMRGRR